MLRRALLLACCASGARARSHLRHAAEEKLGLAGLLKHLIALRKLGAHDAQAYTELSDADLTRAGLDAAELSAYRAGVANYTPPAGPPMFWPEQYMLEMQHRIRRGKDRKDQTTWRKLLTNAIRPVDAAEQSRLRQLAGQFSLPVCFGVARANRHRGHFVSIIPRFESLGASNGSALRQMADEEWREIGLSTIDVRRLRQLLGGSSEGTSPRPWQRTAVEAPQARMAPAPAPLAAPGVADGCWHVFIDAGANRGHNLQHLFDSGVYASAPLQPHYDRAFGFRAAERRRSVCAIAIEPNPRLAPSLRRVRAEMIALGARGVSLLTETAVATADAPRSRPFYVDAESKYNRDMVGSSLFDHRKLNKNISLHGGQARPELVSTVNLARLVRGVLNRTLPARGSAAAGTVPPAVMIKMDVEVRIRSTRAMPPRGLHASML